MKVVCAKTRMDVALCGCSPCTATTVLGDPDKPTLASLIHNGDWLNDQDFPALVELIVGLIPEGFTVLAGAPKAGKSWLAMAVCLAAAEGGIVLGGIRVARRDVLYLALEDGHRRMQSRARGLLGGRRIPKRFNYVLDVAKGDALALIREWLESIENPGTAVVVIDTAQKVRPPSRPGVPMYEADYDFGTTIKALASEHPGLVVIAVHHTRKMQSGDFVEAVSGSHGFTGSADTIIVLNRERNSDEGTLSVTSRDGQEGTYLIERKGVAWQLVGGSLESAATAAAERIEAGNLGDVSLDLLAHIAAHPLCSPAEMKAAMPHIPGNVVDKNLQRLVDSGRLHKPSRGRYVRATRPGQPTVTEVDDLDLDLLESEFTA